MSNVIKVYITRLRQFSPNARLLLASLVLTGASLGVYRLLFNFYALSLGIDESIIGNFITVNSMTALEIPTSVASPKIGNFLKIVHNARRLECTSSLAPGMSLTEILPSPRI